MLFAVGCTPDDLNISTYETFYDLKFVILISILYIFTRESRMLRASLSSSGRLSVCHTCDLYQNGASKDHEIFTVGCPKVSSLS